MNLKGLLENNRHVDVTSLSDGIKCLTAMRETFESGLTINVAAIP